MALVFASVRLAAERTSGTCDLIRIGSNAEETMGRYPRAPRTVRFSAECGDAAGDPGVCRTGLRRVRERTGCRQRPTGDGECRCSPPARDLPPRITRPLIHR